MSSYFSEKHNHCSFILLHSTTTNYHITSGAATCVICDYVKSSHCHIETQLLIILVNLFSVLESFFFVLVIDMSVLSLGLVLEGKVLVNNTAILCFNRPLALDVASGSPIHATAKTCPSFHVDQELFSVQLLELIF